MWAHALTTAIGIWLMASPSVLGYGEPAQSNDWIVGPIVATFGCVAMWQATRGCRWANVVLGLWLVAAPWVLGYWVNPYDGVALANSTAAGLLTLGLSLVHGGHPHEIGGGWGVLWRGERA